jgi:2-keto-3-deoxy-L-rhamnonate aldolase RhmA
METVADMIRGCKSVGLASIIRVPRLETFFISRILDAGAEGIMVPMTSTREDAERIVRYSKFAPLGLRGFGNQTGQTDYKPLNTAQFMKEANDHTLIVAQIETQEAIDNIEEILNVKGIDVAVIGPNDLSISLGVPDQMESDVMNKAIGRVVEVAKKKKKASGIHVGNLSMVRNWRSMGMNFLAYSTDISFMYTASKTGLEQLKAP